MHIYTFGRLNNYYKMCRVVIKIDSGNYQVIVMRITCIHGEESSTAVLLVCTFVGPAYAICSAVAVASSLGPNAPAL